MAIVPRGKIRLMEAQSIGNPMLDSTNPPHLGEEPTPEIAPDAGIGPDQIEQKADDMAEGQDPILQKGGEGKTLSDYIFKKLQGYGYPPRRLEEFKKKFVDQDISAEGTENVRVEIPDKKYPNPQTGRAETIESQELKNIIREVNKNFGLHFGGANRSEGKWTINFTSEKATDEDPTGGVTDNLDEVYGTPSKGKGGGKSKGRPTRASTIQEMIKETKDKDYDMLKKIIGEKNAS